VRKLLLFPLRLCVGWGLSPRLLGLIGATVLVLLRVAVGWHFYSEGMDKRESGNWTAAPFFANAKGPLAEEFRSLVWDADGTYRLNKGAIEYSFAEYREYSKLHFSFDDRQKDAAQDNYSKAIATYDQIIASNATELEEFKLGVDRVKKLSSGGTTEQKTRDGVSSLGGQRDMIRREWKQKGAATFAQIGSLWKAYEGQQNALATPEQMEAYGYHEFFKPRVHPVIDTSQIDRITPYFDIAIGICLLIGLFTPVAGLAAAGFLFTVVASQFPPGTGPTSSMYQLIEGVACLVLAATGAGRFAGADYFLHLIVRKVWGEDYE